MGIPLFVGCEVPGDSKGLRLVFSYGKFGEDSDSELEIVLHFLV